MDGLKFTRLRLKKKYKVYVGGKHVVTKKQMKTLSDMGLENAEDIEKMLIKK